MEGWPVLWSREEDCEGGWKGCLFNGQGRKTVKADGRVTIGMVTTILDSRGRVLNLIDRYAYFISGCGAYLIFSQLLQLKTSERVT
jgi:hypothetical protein